MSHVKIIINNISLKKIAIFSIVLVLFSFVAYLFETSFYYKFCGDKIYTSGFGKCKELFEYTANLIKIIMLVLSLVLSLLSLIKVVRLHKGFLIFLGLLIISGALLSLITWDNDSSGFFNINFGPILIGLTLLVLAVSITAFSWGFLLKNNYILFFPFLIIIFTFLHYSEDVVSKLNQNMTSPANISGDVSDCDTVRLEKAKDKCIWHSAIKADNIEQCSLIVDTSVRTDCLNFVYRNRGAKTKDTKWCELISDPYQKKICLD